MAEVFSPHSAGRRKIAFTLAEVLITLGIIGVVAALTLPTLIQNYKRQEVVNKLKSNISIIQNAIKMAEVKHGFIEDWEDCTPDEIDGKSNNYNCSKLYFERYIAPELKLLKTCIPTSEECWTDAKTLYNLDYLSNSNGDAVSAIMQNGVSIYMWAGDNSASSTSKHLQIWFDIDGPNKGQGRLGADVFGLYVMRREAATMRKGVFMIGGGSKQNVDLDYFKSNEEHGCNSSGRYAGRYCGALIQANDWEIPDDYPVKF